MSANSDNTDSCNIQLSGRSRLIAAAVIILLCVFVFAGLCLYQYCRFSKYEAVDIDRIPAADAAGYSWEIESITDNGGHYLLNGWIARMGESIYTYSLNLVIEKDNGKAYLVPLEMIERKDLSDMLNSGTPAFDYTASGFSATVNGRCFSPDDTLYILYGNNGRYELVDLSAADQKENN